MDTVIEIRGLTKTYGAVKALDGLTLSIPRGGVYGVLGPNGAGKSTLFRTLLGLIRPTEGDATVMGGRVGDPTSMRRMGSMIETPRFPPFMTARQVLADAAPQPAAIGTRVGQAVDVIDAQTVDQAALDQFENHGMCLFEHLAMLDAQCAELVDIEKAPPVDVVRRGTPAGDAVMLTFEQCVQTLLRRFVTALNAGVIG